MRIVVLGATSALGQRVVARLCDLDHAVVATGRSSERLQRVDRRAETAMASMADADTLRPLLTSADRIINIAHASTIKQLIALVPDTCQRLIVVGSTRRDSKVPNLGADQVRHGEVIFLGSGLPGAILHPTMIYGGGSEANITRILALVRRWPRWLPLLWPVPDGGRALVQPVYIDDVAAALVAAVTADGPIARSFVVAGPQPIPLADMLRTCADACGRRLSILPVPTSVLIGAARLVTTLSNRGPFSVAELQRSREDKAYDIDALRTELGVEPRSFSEGIRLLAAERLYQTK
ncbi:MAG: NAD(P)H-binding protein [Alphaproteobacteria bacterium]|nr:NAD(P)H-binding protein [Alphaproteobacteria bacterium]